MENTLHEQLVKIQQTLKAPKGQTNTFGNYKYRSCEDILEAVKPLLNGLHLVISDEIVHFPSTSVPTVVNVKDSKGNLVTEIVGGDRFYVKATAIISDGKDVIETYAYAREEENKKGMDGAQVTGAASSYARKYALNGLFAIDDTKDADTMDNTKKEATEPVKVTAETRVEAQSAQFCSVHQRDMKQREFDGQIYYDHRLEIDGVWNKCQGKGWKADKPKVTDDASDYIA